MCRHLVALLAMLSGAVPAGAETADEAFAALTASVARGDPETDLVATGIERGDGCSVTLVTRSRASGDVPLRLETTVDLSRVNVEGPYDRMSDLITDTPLEVLKFDGMPRSFEVITTVAAPAEGDAARNAFADRFPGARCGDTECRASLREPAVTFFILDADSGGQMAAIVDAVRAFRRTCQE